MKKFDWDRPVTRREIGMVIYVILIVIPLYQRGQKIISKQP